MHNSYKNIEREQQSELEQKPLFLGKSWGGNPSLQGAFGNNAHAL